MEQAFFPLHDLHFDKYVWSVEIVFAYSHFTSRAMLLFDMPKVV